ncbi:MAG TPA: hypothetical protein DIC18_02255 [Clostridiales bacterium]|nr:hypothetical protein [Clostridiales bacterium]
MELSAMLEYQKLDKEMMALESELMQSPIAREYATSKHALAVAQDQVIKQNRDAGDMVKQMEGLIAEYDALEKELKEAESAVPDVADVNGADFFIRNVQKLISQLKNLASEIGKMSAKIVELNQNHAATMAAGKEAKKKFTQCKEPYDVEKEKYRPAAAALQQKIAEAEKNCSEDFLNVYKRLRKMKKFPVIVPLANGRSCGGCYMELAWDTLVTLDSKPFIECPSCGRILYKD